MLLSIALFLNVKDYTLGVIQLQLGVCQLRKRALLSGIMVYHANQSLCSKIFTKVPSKINFDMLTLDSW
jgi:hypothetical protein